MHIVYLIVKHESQVLIKCHTAPRCIIHWSFDFKYQLVWRGFHDGDDLCHRGFACFEELLTKYQPKIFLHGHMHLNYGGGLPRVSTYGGTQVINAYRTYLFDPEEPGRPLPMP